MLPDAVGRPLVGRNLLSPGSPLSVSSTQWDSQESSPAGKLEAPALRPAFHRELPSSKRPLLCPYTQPRPGLQTTPPRLGGGEDPPPPLVSTHQLDFPRVPDGP